jgi:hypothetical protein
VKRFGDAVAVDGLDLESTWSGLLAEGAEATAQMSPHAPKVLSA